MTTTTTTPTSLAPAIANSKAFVNSEEAYQALYQQSINDPNTFWATIAKNNFFWQQPFDENKPVSYNFDTNKGDVNIQWFAGGKTNICYNALDKHLPTRKNQVAFHWEGNDLTDAHRPYTYGELYDEVCLFANVLKKNGVKKGDRVGLYLPMVIELPVAVLACARIGAVHSVVFAGFSAESLANRILDSQCKIIITADAVFRGNKLISLKKEVDEACDKCVQEGFNVERVIVVKRQGDKIKWVPNRDAWFHDELQGVEKHCDVEWVNAEDPLFMLYTSGSTGKPKGMC